MNLKNLSERIFTIRSDNEFNEIALEIFHLQYHHNAVYKQFVDLNITSVGNINHYLKIPYLPVEFFKSHKIITGSQQPETTFFSSGTSGAISSKHYVVDTALYRKSFLNCFSLFYGHPGHYIILALLPSYLERQNSSLVYMIEKLISASGNPAGGFYLDNYESLLERLNNPEGKEILLIGVSFALLDIAEKFEIPGFNGIVMETGGMKGRKKEIVREELHTILKSKFRLPVIHSEYGMTELLSQAYSIGDGIFKSPPWMKVLIRDVNDPKELLENSKTGGINIIDLANIYSCSFIATQDLGRINADGSFEVLGRFDHSDIRGCSLLV
jgi:phenylacetate-coenzyme A ligase PaaK-like adenylate-forming protein